MTTAEQMINAQWFIEVKIPWREWQAITPTDNDRLSPMNRELWEKVREDFPCFPLRIKAYVRWSDVLNQQQAEERAIAWAEGPDVKRPGRVGTFYVTGKRPPAKYELEEVGEE